MKKLTIITLSITPFIANAQSYSRESIGQHIVDNMLSFLITYTLLFMLFYGISFIEGIKKTKPKSNSDDRNLITWSIGLFVGVIVLFAMMKEANLNTLMVFITVIIRLMVASFVSSEAKKLGRNRILWWFLGFLEYHIALIVLGISPRLIKTSKDSLTTIVNLNLKHQEQSDNLLALKKSQILSPNEFSEKKRILREQYLIKLNLLLDDERKSINLEREQDAILKLKEAYKKGLLTKVEFDEKVKASKK